MECEQCGKKSGDGGYFDYCAACGANLCPDCMESGHCDAVPALSGSAADGLTDDEETGEGEKGE